MLQIKSNYFSYFCVPSFCISYAIIVSILYKIIPVAFVMFILSDILHQLCKPSEVSFPMEQNRPPFLTEKWLRDNVNLIAQSYDARDTPAVPVLPAAFVRCGRGGKTRALLELTRALKDRFNSEEVAVIYISFTAHSSLLKWETMNPIDAICRRIAFAALPNTAGESFEKFAETVEVSSSAVLKWLGNTPRILLIDELDSFTNLQNPESILMQEMGAFLKMNFLSRANQYFVFSSKGMLTTDQLSQFLERAVLIRELPIVADLFIAAKNCEYPALGRNDLLFYGCIPSLVYLSERGNSFIPNESGQNAITQCVKDGVSESLIDNLLRSFLDGNPDLVPPALLPLMDTTADKKVRWIPHNMVKALRELVKVAPRKYDLYFYMLKTICNYFDASVSFGGWKRLFVIVLLIRILSNQFDGKLLPLDVDEFKDCSVSHNYFMESKTDRALYLCTNVDEYIRSFTTPDVFPHIAVFCPNHAKFEVFDVIVAAFDKKGERTLYGYKLRPESGRVKPLDLTKHDWLREKWFQSIYSVASNSVAAEGWIAPNEKDLDAFFGFSGQRWTPHRWFALNPFHGKKKAIRRKRAGQSRTSSSLSNIVILCVTDSQE